MFRAKFNQSEEEFNTIAYKRKKKKHFGFSRESGKNLHSARNSDMFFENTNAQTRLPTNIREYFLSRAFQPSSSYFGRNPGTPSAIWRVGYYNEESVIM